MKAQSQFSSKLYACNVSEVRYPGTIAPAQRITMDVPPGALDALRHVVLHTGADSLPTDIDPECLGVLKELFGKLQ